VEHTVSEEITSIDIVQSQILIASGKTLQELNLNQDQIPAPMVCAMQCRVTTEDPTQDFRPDTGTINVFRMPAGMGIRLDDGKSSFMSHIYLHCTPHLGLKLVFSFFAKQILRSLNLQVPAFLVRASRLTTIPCL
jgi:pyruvate carboxylase